MEFRIENDHTMIFVALFVEFIGNVRKFRRCVQEFLAHAGAPFRHITHIMPKIIQRVKYIRINLIQFLRVTWISELARNES
jgi:hypothetical protein